jgi:hypothetical protein
MKTSKPFNPSASTQKANATAFSSMLATKVQGRHGGPLPGSPPTKTYKKKQYTTSSNHLGTKEVKKSPNQ